MFFWAIVAQSLYDTLNNISDLRHLSLSQLSIALLLTTYLMADSPKNEHASTKWRYPDPLYIMAGSWELRQRHAFDIAKLFLPKQGQTVRIGESPLGCKNKDIFYQYACAYCFVGPQKSAVQLFSIILLGLLWRYPLTESRGNILLFLLNTYTWPIRSFKLSLDDHLQVKKKKSC